jgi:hypothetical protein
MFHIDDDFITDRKRKLAGSDFDKNAGPADIPGVCLKYPAADI